MEDDTNLDEAVDEIVAQAQNLHGWKQTIREDITAKGENADQVRIIVAHKAGDTYTATEIQGYPTD